MVDDKKLAHMCTLSAVVVDMIRNPMGLEDAIRTGFYNDGEGGEAELKGTMNCLNILADTYVELMHRQGMKPAFRRTSSTSDGEG